MNRKLWRWIFGIYENPTVVPAFNPIKANAVFQEMADKQQTLLLITAIRMRGLWLRKNIGRQGRANLALMEL